MGVTSLGAGLTADSAALVAFGLSSLVDSTASSVLIWRFRHERLGVRTVEDVERRAARVVGAILVGVAVFVVLHASFALAEHSGPESSTLGEALTLVSMAVLPILATAKLRLAKWLNTPSLRADGVLSAAGAVLAAATLIGLVLNAALDWWWADSVAALFISAVLLREGTLTVKPPK
jgi:divalent metal cation (Fe/Co/Zn/Cd) transporter